jgi:hypothetical protein
MCKLISYSWCEMDRTEEARFIIRKLRERFHSVEFQLVEYNNGNTPRIQAIQKAINTEKGVRRKVSDKRIQAAIIEFHEEFTIGAI